MKKCWGREEGLPVDRGLPGAEDIWTSRVWSRGLMTSYTPSERLPHTPCVCQVDLDE